MLGAFTSRLSYLAHSAHTVADDPTLDARLTFIRRQSGLDPRAALFVLSPVSQAEIGDFVRRCVIAPFIVRHRMNVDCKVYKMPSTNQRLNTTPTTRNASGGNAIGTHNQAPTLYPILPWRARESRDPCGLKAGRYGTNTRWPALRSFVVRIRLRSSTSLAWLVL